MEREVRELKGALEQKALELKQKALLLQSSEEQQVKRSLAFIVAACTAITLQSSRQFRTS